MNSGGLKRAARIHATKIRTEIKKERKFNRIRRIAQMEQKSEALLNAIRPNHVNPISVDHFKEAIAVLSGKSTK